MKPEFLTMLPEELRAAVRKAEELVDSEIAVKADSGAETVAGLKTLEGGGNYRATIVYRGERISRCALVHEVLHLKRTWLDAAPMLRPTGFGYKREAAYVTELIDHLAIISEEQRFEEAASYAHWSSVMTDLAESLPLTREGLYRTLLLEHAMMDIALPGLDRSRLDKRLQHAGLVETGAEFVDVLRELRHDDESALKYVAEQFGYDLTSLCIGRLELRTEPKGIRCSSPLARSPSAVRSPSL